jgi:hypothetical protein
MRGVFGTWCAVSAAVAGCGGATAEPADAAPAPPPDAEAPPDAHGALRLSEMGLFSDVVTRTLAPGVATYEPAHALWADAADKQRWVLLPEGSTIDTSDPDHWRFPVGTRLFKEFSLDGMVIETRVLWHRAEGDAENAWFAGAFLWAADGADATFVPEGQKDALGTAHDVPRAVKCWECHRGEPGHVLGFSALQLAHAGTGVTLTSLVDGGALSVPLDPTALALPGDARTASALGYLHANCGHCHNSEGPAFEDVDLVLRISFDELGTTAPAATRLYATTVGVALQKWAVEPYTTRVVAGDPAASALRARMAIRGAALDQMPPLATESPDQAALATIDDWIQQLASP